VSRLAALKLGVFGLPATMAGLLLMESGIPVPIPADLLLLAFGERAAAAGIPLWVAALILEVIALAGTTVLFMSASGPARFLLRRAGARVGLTAHRIESSGRFLGRHGRPALVAGRATPGLRTATVVAAASARIPAATALPALFLGSSIFLQAHLVLGYWLGPKALALLSGATAPLLLGLGLLAAAGAVFWVLRRRGRAGLREWTEASCPVCLAVAAATREPAAGAE
jgi:membrane protein DedA with SNARE-associated domain